jgi:diketogulonate reductase-like aldo/keto reductase
MTAAPPASAATKHGRAFGASRARVPVIGQGTWNMESDDRARAIAALRRGLDLGLTHIDTAEMYGHGKVEQLVGEAIAGRRDEVFLVSKVLPSNASYEGTKTACERSLKRLRTDHLDCYLLHWPGSHPLDDTLRAFADLRDAGKIRSFGVSNFDEHELDDAVRLAGKGQIACNQVLYHLQQRAIEHAVLPACERHDVALVGYSPFGSGRFPARDATLDRLATKHGATPRQIALAFLTRHPATFAIPKASTVAHVADNHGALRVTLDADDLAAIDAAFPPGRSRSLPTL